jgi:hypothetical protein
MRALVATISALSLAAIQAWGQQQPLENSASSKDSITSARAARVDAAVKELETKSPSVNIGKDVKVEGPAVSVFKGAKLRQIPGRVLHLVNPFSSSGGERTVRVNRELNPTPWATAVGFSPGSSAFPDPTTHESKMGLISFSRP